MTITVKRFDDLNIFDFGNSITHNINSHSSLHLVKSSDSTE